MMWTALASILSSASFAEQSVVIAYGSSTNGLAAALGAAALLLVAIAAPVCHSLSGVLPAKLRLVAPDQPVECSTSSSSSSNNCTVTVATSAAELTRQVSEEELDESEERLLRALGYDGQEEDDAGGGLTEAEIAAFKLRNSDASDSPPVVRFKDRVAEPLSEIVKSWHAQKQNQQTTASEGKSGGGNGSPCLNNKLGGGECSPALVKAGTPTGGKRGAKANNSKSSARRADKKHRG